MASFENDIIFSKQIAVIMKCQSGFYQSERQKTEVSNRDKSNFIKFCGCNLSCLVPSKATFFACSQIKLYTNNSSLTNTMAYWGQFYCKIELKISMLNFVSIYGSNIDATLWHYQIILKQITFFFFYSGPEKFINSPEISRNQLNQQNQYNFSKIRDH